LHCVTHESDKIKYFVLTHSLRQRNILNLNSVNNIISFIILLNLC